MKCVEVYFDSIAINQSTALVTYLVHVMVIHVSAKFGLSLLKNGRSLVVILFANGNNKQSEAY